MFDKYQDVVSCKQLQEMLNISRPKVYELLRSNVIPHRKIGKKYIIPKWGVKEYLMNCHGKKTHVTKTQQKRE